MKTRALLSIAGMISLLALFSCTQKPMEDPMAKTEADNKAKYQLILEGFNTFNEAILDSVIDANGIDHSGDTTYVGAEMAKQALQAFKTGFPDGKTEILHIIAEGDMVIAHLTFSGTHTGDFFGIPASNKPVKYESVDIVRFKDGKAFEHWYVQDNYAMMSQMGAIPSGEKK